MSISKWYETPVLLGVITWLVAGCTVSPSPALQPSRPASVTPLPSAVPAATPTCRPTQSPTAIRILTLTPTPAPTLSAEAREAYVEELLRTNAGCELPCWWGIVPGETTWTDTERFLMQMGIRTVSNAGSSGTIFHEAGGFDFRRQGVYNGINFWEREGIVESLQIRTQSNLPENLKALWARLSPEQVIAAYGQPSRVWVQTFASSSELPYGDTMAYDLWLFYDALGFVIRYGGRARYEPIYRLCPTFGEGGNLGLSIEMYLQSPADQRPLEELVGERMGIPESIHSIEEAAGLSVEDFYALFTQGEGPICFETPRDIWP